LVFTANPISPVLLTITKPGYGKGMVSSAPEGILCGDDCIKPFLPGTTIKLTATPQTGSSFVGWNGGECIGTLPCTLTLAKDINISAIFVPDSTSRNQLFSSISPPASRSVMIGTSASAFASIINSGPDVATFCRISPKTRIPGEFFFQTTDAATNKLIGTPIFLREKGINLAEALPGYDLPVYFHCF